MQGVKYLHTIYTVSTQYLHSIYTISTLSTQCCFTLGEVSPKVSLRCPEQSRTLLCFPRPAHNTLALDIMQHGVLNHNILPGEWQLASFCEKCSRYDQK